MFISNSGTLNQIKLKYDLTKQNRQTF